MDILLDAHSGLRWLVLAGVAGTAIWGLGRGREPLPSWPRFVAAVLGLQILLGLVLWAANSGWSQGWFIAWWHPLAMVAALGLFQVGMARAREASRPRQLGGFAVLTLVVIVLAIPWQRGLV